MEIKLTEQQTAERNQLTVNYAVTQDAFANSERRALTAEGRYQEAVQNRNIEQSRFDSSKKALEAFDSNLAAEAEAKVEAKAEANGEDEKPDGMNQPEWDHANEKFVEIPDNDLGSAG